MNSSIINAIAGGVSALASGTTKNNAAAGAAAPQPQTQRQGSERDLFMTLLVAQLKNQDPLAPQDGTQFVAQLAQFNSLDQLIGIRSALDELLTRTGGNSEAGDAPAPQVSTK